uniref:Ig-like domain-containing protein n=1 Tax=Neogobius melanostomus TaxID=47308 RepID=A0A8C6WKS4_9GOBI
MIHFLSDLLTNATPLKPTVEIVTGHSRVFTGDTVRLKCNFPDTPYKSTWFYKWYNGPEQLPFFDDQLVLWDIKTKETGKYYCQGLPVEISVDGGWAILDAPSQGVVGYPMNMTCRVRGKRPINEVVLYRDGVEVLKQKHPHFLLDNVTLEDWGGYTCVASWNHGRTHSVISAPVSVQVLEPLTQPTLVIIEDEMTRSLSMLKLVCVLDYNVPAPAPPVLYYFYMNNDRLGTPTSENFTLIKKSRGSFKCQAKVSELGLFRWSEPESF